MLLLPCTGQCKHSDQSKLQHLALIRVPGKSCASIFLSLQGAALEPNGARERIGCMPGMLGSAVASVQTQRLPQARPMLAR